MNRSATLLMASVVGFAGGCASVFQRTTQTIPVTSDPPGARLTVLVDGQATLEAETPTSINVDKGRDVKLELQLPGHQSAHVDLDRAFSGGFLADLMLVAPLSLIVDLLDGAAWKYPPAVDVTLEPTGAPPSASDVGEEPGRGATPGGPSGDLRLTVALLAGTGYGWSSGDADVNADTRFSGASWARLGHLVPEIGLLSLREQMFVSAGARYQVIDGTTDVYAPNGQVFHARTSALAFFSKLGWLLGSPDRALQPFLSLSWGWGRIAHIVRLPQFRNCGPQANQECVDTISSGPWFVGAGAGLRLRLTEGLYAVAALETQAAAPQRGYNVDGDLGLAMVF